MDLAMIEYVDGFTDMVVRREARADVPEGLRTIYLKDGVPVATREEADEIAPIVRVVATPLDAEARPVPEEQAQRLVVREYDALGQCRRTTVMRLGDRA